MTRLLPTLVLLSSCGGLTALSPDDTADIGNPDGHTDTDAGPLDSSDHDGTNVAPEADAGPDQTVEVGDVVALDGANSSDPDGDNLAYEWEMVEMPSSSSTAVINEHRATPQFWADVQGRYVLELTVDDGQLSATDEVEITAELANGAPTANAGPDQAVSVGDTVQLNGSGSTDPDGDTLTFAWTLVTKPTSSAAKLDSATSTMPRFTADAAGAYELQLVVSDGASSSSADSVRVTAQSSDDGDCLSCAAEAERTIRLRWTRGDLSTGPALVLIPILALFWQRKRR